MIKVLELFGGIGACSKALERLGIDYEIADYVEIDKYAVKSFNAIHNTNFEPQDVCKWDKDIEVDLVMHGSPCQDFSLAGLQAGGDEGSGTRSSLMYETLRIVEKLKPKYVIWENVKNMISKKHIHNFNNYIYKMDQLGYTSYWQVLNAKDYGIPQNRERVFTVSIRNDVNNGFVFPEKQELKLKLKDMLEDQVDEKYYLSDKMIQYISKTGTANFRNPDSKINLDIARPLTTEQNKRAGTTNYLSNEFPDNYELKQVGQLYGTEREPNPQDGRVYDSDGLIPTLDTKHVPKMAINDEIEVNRKYGVFDKENQKHQAGSVYDSKGLAPTLDTMQGGYRQPCVEISGGSYAREMQDLRIRKLTPKECWRLMGFDDSDFERAEKVNSNTQLYKQAGNSIVVNVLEAILRNLLLEPTQLKGQTNIYEFI
jgi:DNA (cytosine-5)-methyltransferase 1